MGFFDLFKRKKTEPKVEEPKIEQPAVEVAEVAPCEPEPVQECVPEERVADNASQEVVAEVSAEQVVVEEPKIVEEKPQEVAVEEDDDDEPNIEEERKELEAGLEKTKEGFFGRLKRAIAGRTTVDADVLDDLEEMLITSDVGVETTVKIIEAIEARVARDKYMNTSELNDILREEIAYLMEESHRSTRDFGIEVKEGFPYVMMVVGVNGAGKTTTIGKLAAKLTRAGRKVYIGAADTFRAAAIDQLAVWAERAGATMVRQDMGSDPASVAYDTLRSAVANGADVVLIDTAGRLHNKVGLMKELTKIRNVMSKVIPDAPHEVMLVLDGSTGQNAFEQAKQFTEATQVTSLTITKLDGTAKGGVVIGISDKFHIPVRYIGIGEGIDQLKMFDRKEFVRALFGDAKN
jgi:fused signal recognition particle receptor